MDSKILSTGAKFLNDSSQLLRPDGQKLRTELDIDAFLPALVITGSVLTAGFKRFDGILDEIPEGTVERLWDNQSFCITGKNARFAGGFVWPCIAAG